MLSTGDRLGSYDIVALLGVGGMGEVYRARDTKLGRDVAIKVLPSSLTSDPDRLARFQREAQVLAALNHSNIAAIHHVEETTDGPALVMELVEGETLADRIARGPIPTDEALPIAKQIAGALEAAHEQGIIHRDLKPANIKVRPDGTVKVLDFGLAKLAEPTAASSINPPALSMSPTITSPALMSGVGVLLGTAAYMSPEQATGKPADKRSDIWAFGCVLYEMVAGKAPFAGEDVSDTLANILKREPDWSALPGNVPPIVQDMLRRCLEKNPRTRCGHIAVALFALNEPFFERIGAANRLQQRTWRRRSMVNALALILAGAAVAGGIVWFAIRPLRPRALRANILTSGAMPLVVQGNDSDLAITPDGSHLVYRSSNQLAIRAIDQLDPKALSGLGNPRNPFISPDGRWVGFFDGSGALRKVELSGGPPVTVAKIDGAGPRGGTWGEGDTIIYATADESTGLMRVPAAGGDPIVLTRPDHSQGEADHRWPEFLPGGRTVLFTILPSTGGLDGAQVAVLDLSTQKYVVLFRGGYHARYVAAGYLVFGASNTLRAVRFDLSRLQVVGTSVPVLQDVFTVGSGAVNAAIAADGTLVYVPRSAGSSVARSLVWVTRSGREEPVSAPRRGYDSFQLSPDGTRAIIQCGDEDNDLWVWDFTRGILTRLTFTPEIDFDPLWMPDGRHIVFSRGGGATGALLSRAADGTGSEEPLAPGTAMTATSFSPDGKELIFAEQNDLKMLVMDTKKVVPLTRTMFTERRGQLSPDGRLLA
jgi:serine/threonine-protein kinase